MAPAATDERINESAPSAAAAKGIKNNVFNAMATEANSKGADAGAKEGIGAGDTFKHQRELPKLPIPKLEDTCKRYLESLQGLQDAEAHSKTKQAVEEFLKNEGPKLQDDLIKYADSRSSYIEEFWDESYLQASGSVVLNLNPFFVLEDDPTPSRGNQLMRATSLILASLAFVHDLRTGVLPADDVRAPLDMYQYTRLFGTARIPTANGCRMETAVESRHVVVIRKGQFYWFEALDDEHRPLLTERALLGNLQTIMTDADQTKPTEVAQGAMGVLTTQSRKIWSEHRELIQSDRNNARCLEVIDTALFIVCLDDAEPPNTAELCNSMLCGTYALQDGVQVGTCTNRWYDKAVQLIICANGAAGINFEHTGVDGHTVLRYVADIYTELIMRFAKSINSKTQSLFKAKTSPYAKGAGKKSTQPDHDDKQLQVVEMDTAPKKLEWTSNDGLKKAVRFAETRLSDLICQNECQVLEYTQYGKNFITRHKFSPDAFVQMAFQAAYMHLYGRAETTYEPAMTKAFLHGRTEAIRTVQSYTTRFTETFEKSDAAPEEKLRTLREACQGHAKLSKACASGQGHDRHLYALHHLYEKLTAGDDKAQLPAIFRDAGYATLNTTILSTSNCGNPALRLFGFGPVSPGGFGIGYIIKDDGISVVASSKHLQTSRFLDTLSKYLDEVQRLIIQTYQSANKRVQQTYIDHAGVECDVRTGKPIGSRQNEGNGYTDDWDSMSKNAVGVSGYGFFDAGSQDDGGKTPGVQGKENKPSRHAGVGRTLVAQEYS